MTAPLAKLLPLTVRVIAPLPAMAEFGVRNDKTGTGLAGALIVNVSALEVPPPGEGLKTLTCEFPALVRSLAGIEARNSVAEMNVAGLDPPFH